MRLIYKGLAKCFCKLQCRYKFHVMMFVKTYPLSVEDTLPNRLVNLEEDLGQRTPTVEPLILTVGKI